MPALIRISLLVLLAIVSMDVCPQCSLHKKNRYDSNGKKHGYWVETSKLNPEKQTFKGWYDHGKETKKCIYYNDGVKCSKFRYVNDSLMRIRRYDSLGNLEYKGSALLLKKKDELRFCWDGEFVFYDSHRNIIRKVVYKRGEEQDLE
jgi:antitoxin component YwqK of YwqJK toxin-antitoxin module